MKINKLALLPLVLIMSLNIVSCNKQQQEVKKEVLRPVKYATVKNSSAENLKTFAGIVQADIKTYLSFKVGGEIDNIYVSLGEYVKKGQLLATISPSTFKIKLEDINANLEQAKAKNINAQRDYERLSALYIDGAISDRQLDASKAQAKAAKAQLNSIEKKLELAKIYLNDTKLYAPMNGYISESLKEVNENVDAYKPVFTFISNTHPEVFVDMPEAYINNIKPHSTVQVKFNTLEGKTYNGRVASIGVDAKKGSTYPVKIVIQNYDSKIKSGMSADVIFNFKNNQNKIYVPISAITEDNNGRYVYIVTPENQTIGVVSKAKIETGSISSQGVEVIKGLKQGDKVVTAGTSKMIEGMKVKLGAEI